MKSYKFALAVTKRTFEEKINNTAEYDCLNVITRSKSTPDETYIIITGDWVSLGLPFNRIVNKIANIRHALITISDEDEVYKEIVTDDDEGCDEEFEYILGISYKINAWNEDEPLV